jgi:hypothetical protein
LERVLHQKKIGDEVRITFSKEALGDECGHLLRPLRIALHLKQIPETLYLHARITAIEEPESREIITAMAEAVKGDGCGGDCDCGCS